MSGRSEPVAGERPFPLARGITATWWYTATGVMFFEAALVLLWVTILAGAGLPSGRIAVVGIGGAVWCAATIPLVLHYRNRGDAAPRPPRWQVLTPVLVSIAVGVVSGVAAGVWLAGLLPVVQALVLLDWPPGVRLRVVLTATLLLAALWFVDSRALLDGNTIAEGWSWWFLGFYSTSFPLLTVLSLWWWDVLVALDRARASEARLGATQERLRVATDVHDLQGHHLQVIALQLELAEKLMTKDPDAALEQLRAARTSVDDARQGTRDLATRFRSVPLRDEIANAVELLRAAGTIVDARVDASADDAPGSVLGPVIRETTTNVLRHGGGRRAGVTLTRSGASWRYEISNDVPAGATANGDGAGLEGIVRRVAEAGGTVEVQRGGQEFTLTVTVPTAVEER